MAELTICEKFLINFGRYFLGLVLLPGNFIFVQFCNFIEYLESRNAGIGLQDPKSIQVKKKRHLEKVSQVQDQVRDWNKNGKGKTKMCSARAGWKMLSFGSPSYKKTLTGIKLGALNEIISMDPINQTLTVEPNVSMGKIARVLLPLGWTLQVLPELEELTIGGLITGAGIESSSHKFGIFEKTCISYELVLPNGSILNCSENENTDMFYAVPSSHGTLGFLTLVKLRIMKCSKYVKVQYLPCTSLDQTVQTYERESLKRDGNLFVEGIVYGLNSAVVIVGNFTENLEISKINKIRRWYKPWFFKYVQNFLNPKFKGCELIDYIPTKDYYFRHTQSMFWESENFVPFGNNFVFRYLLGWLLPLRIAFLKIIGPAWYMTIFTKNNLIEDFGFPYHKLKEMLIYIDEQTKVYPLWLCGAAILRNNKTPKNFESFVEPNCPLYIDIGLYGETRANLKNENLTEKIARIEQHVRKIKGMKALYVDYQSDRDEFRKTYCHDLYEEMRVKYNCIEAFPEIFEKVKAGTRK